MAGVDNAATGAVDQQHHQSKPSLIRLQSIQPATAADLHDEMTDNQHIAVAAADNSNRKMMMSADAGGDMSMDYGGGGATYSATMPPHKHQQSPTHGQKK